MNASSESGVCPTEIFTILLSKLVIKNIRIVQAKSFSNVIDINYLALTKLDGTAKGGVVIGICDQLNIPIKYIGVGESINDLQLFNKKEFVDSLFIDN